MIDMNTAEMEIRILAMQTQLQEMPPGPERTRLKSMMYAINYRASDKTMKEMFGETSI